MSSPGSAISKGPCQSPKRRFLAALFGGPVDRIPVANAVSVAHAELMRACDAFFPEAHLDANVMARLAAAGHEIIGFDTVMPVFSVVQEAAALGCSIAWGSQGMMPAAVSHPFAERGVFELPLDWMGAPSIRVVLDALSLLRTRLGCRVALIGKVMGPWSLSYAMFGTEEFLVRTLTDPDAVARSLEVLKKVTISFARAQIAAGADVICVADHATDMISPLMYGDMLLPVHQHIIAAMGCPTILHCCGNTSDRVSLFANAGFDCFHFESKVDPAHARREAGGRMRLMGNLNCPQLLRSGGTSEIRRACLTVLAAGIPILSPECAVPLDTPSQNLAALVEAAEESVLC